MIKILRTVARLAVLTLALPGALWTVPTSIGGTAAVVTPTGNILVSGCMSITPSGTVAWSMLSILQPSASCTTGIGDAQGNSYLQTVDSALHPIVESFDSSGNVRWTTPTGGFEPWRTGPVVGSNGSVYFAAWNGVTSKVLGFDEQTGVITLDKTFSDVTGLYAYTGGLVVVDADSSVHYLGYDGTVQNSYTTGTPISAYQAYSNAGGASGSVFLAGYPGSCGGNVSVAKFTPTGRAWTWTDTTARNCSSTLLAATPDGGVILARDESAPSPSADFTSIDSAGRFRWDHHAEGPIGPANGGGVLPPTVDVNGVVAMPSAFNYTCPSVSGECPGAQVEFVSQQANVPTLPKIQVTDPADEGFGLDSLATDNGRVYLVGQTSFAPQLLSAFSVPGLAMDYRLALQEALTGGGVSTPPVDSSGDLGSGSLSGLSPGSGGGGQNAATSNICSSVHGSIAKRLLASLKCTAIQSKLAGECAAAVAAIILPQLRSIKALKTTKGLYDLRKVKKSLRPLAKLFNNLKTFKFGPKAPAGFKTGADVIKKLKAARTAYGILKLLPDLAKALSSTDFSEIALDLDKYFHLTPCVEAVANALD